MIYAIVQGAAVTGDINHAAPMPTLPQQSPDGHEVGLNSAMWGRIGPQLQDSHKMLRSILQGRRKRADSSMRRHPMVARAPSRTVTSAGLPVRSAVTQACIWAA